MIAFNSFPVRPEQPAYDDSDEEDAMEIDGGPPERKVTCPGEVLTSAQDFMRCVLACVSRDAVVLRTQAVDTERM